MANNQGKGWFALLVARHIDWKTKIPLYILSALKFVYPNVSPELWQNIFSYRLDQLAAANQFAPAVIAEMRASVNDFASGGKTFQQIRGEMLAKFPGDSLNLFLQTM